MTYIKMVDKVAADRAAEVLTSVIRKHEFRAISDELVGKLYLIIQDDRGIAEFDRAYLVSDVDLAAVSKSDWDFDTWRRETKPEERLEAAVHYFIRRRRLLARQDGSLPLSQDQRLVLTARAEGKPCPPELTHKIRVLEIAAGLGWPEPPPA
jgi:hypothetical protein